MATASKSVARRLTAQLAPDLHLDHTPPTLATAFVTLCAALDACCEADPVTQAQLHGSLILFRHQPVVAWRQVLAILEGVVGASIRTAQ